MPVETPWRFILEFDDDDDEEEVSAEEDAEEIIDSI